MDWSYLFAALGLVLVLEGLLPFASPSAFKQLQAQLHDLTEQQLRLFGGGCVALGLVVLYLAK